MLTPDFVVSVIDWNAAAVIVAVVAALLTFGVTLFALLAQRKLEHETASQTLIHNQYELCRALDLLRVEQPQVSHMLALPAVSDDERWNNYRLFKEHVRTILKDPLKEFTDADRARLYLQEHATALHVCNIYEQTRLQHDLAIEAKDKRRTAVLKMLLDYYEKQMLRNPRLRYHWDHGASNMMADPTRKRYEKYVSRIPGDSPDETSPLDDPTTYPVGMAIVGVFEITQPS